MCASGDEFRVAEGNLKRCGNLDRGVDRGRSSLNARQHPARSRVSRVRNQVRPIAPPIALMFALIAALIRFCGNLW